MSDSPLVSLPSTVMVAPSNLRPARPEVPSSKYYTLRYVLAAALAPGESRIVLPAQSDDSVALFRGCRALGAELRWEDEQERVLLIHGTGRPYQPGPVTINVGNAGAVARLLIGLGALLPEVTIVTDHPQSLGKRPNRELLEALTTLGVRCEGSGPEGWLPITMRGSGIHGGRVTVSGARSSQFLSALLFLSPLLPEGLEIDVVDGLKSQPLVRTTIEVLQEAGIQIEYDASLLHFRVPAGQHYQPCEYHIPGDYPSAAALLAAYAASNDPTSQLTLSRLRPGDEVGEYLFATFERMGADIQRHGDTIILRGGRRLRGFEIDGDPITDCIPVVVAAACFAEGESRIYNVESLHYKESDRINDLCAELNKAGCRLEPQRDAIIIHGRPEGIEGGVTVDGHNDHRLLMALAIAGLRSQRGLTLTGAEHIAKSYPHFFEELRRCGADVQPSRR
ncbi:3-phosphoshikimate 1-carboxyvinyltransferase [Dictyobacter aurantiacus]|uniref:3-phosphoshikimate 1-carboxyvinyltransferase n=1 Tax=Dictyobacter aurantiacus TaxID=1936993 RepID=A0A401ZH51_9CHLR|nr:3-phosphoshikimate 1-carboxyvinyltransferase [Dictyobacter aurantiacus]GCE06166.1 3-phosphoshikimate 1-carboxyvinyltransferase [Dictyobacter aurantiacus]